MQQDQVQMALRILLILAVLYLGILQLSIFLEELKLEYMLILKRWTIKRIRNQPNSKENVKAINKGILCGREGFGAHNGIKGVTHG